MRRRGFLASVTAAGVLVGARTAAAQQGDTEILIERCRIALLEMKNDPRILGMVSLYIENAYGVLVVPNQLKAGFIVGGSFGRGALLARDTTSGAFSEPAFYDLYGGSVGLQVGGQSSEVIYTIMNKPTLDRLINSTSFKLGGDASAAIGPGGASAGVATTPNFGEDIYLFAKNQGLFGGITIDGTVIHPLPEWNKGLYKRDVTVQQIVQGDVANPATQPLRQLLGEF